MPRKLDLFQYNLAQQGFLYPGDEFQSTAVTVRRKDGHHLQAGMWGRQWVPDSLGGGDGSKSVPTGNQRCPHVNEVR